MVFPVVLRRLVSPVLMGLVFPVLRRLLSPVLRILVSPGKVKVVDAGEGTELIKFHVALAI